jgi:hypothetical protein
MDTARFSKLGGRLVIGGKAVTSWNARLTGVGDDRALQLMDQSISNIGNIMERMKSMTELAADESLSVVDRIDIQIGLVKLNTELNYEKEVLSLRMAGQSGAEITKHTGHLRETERWAVEMLERARERVLNGGDLDAAEVYQPENKLSSIEVRTPGGGYFFEDADDFELSQIDPDTAIIINHLVPDGGSMAVTDDPNAPKLSAILADMNIPMALDAQSAKDTMPKFGKRLNELAKMKESLADAIAKTRMERFEAGLQGNAPLSAPSDSARDLSSAPEGGDKELTVQTSIGEMVYIDGDKSNPELRNPINAAG